MIQNRFSGAAAVVALLLLTGCGEQGTTPAKESMGTAQVVAEVGQWWGTPADAQAAEVLVAHSLNGQLDACLAKLGYPRFDWRRSIFPSDHRDPLSGSAVLGLGDSLLFANGYERDLEFRSVENELNSPPDRGQQEIAAEDDCAEERARTALSDDEIDALRLPHSSEKLRVKWEEVVRKSEAEVVAFDELQTCVDAKKVPEMRGRSIDEVAHLADEIKREFESEGLSAKAALADFTQWDKAVAGAVRTCTEPYADSAETALVRTHQQFVREHATQIDQAEKEWASIRRQAEELGWSEDSPYAGLSR